MKQIYLDNAASAPLNKKVLRMLHKVGYMQGNPQGMNGEALASFHKLQWARFQVACAIGADEDEIFFCSGATEANNFAKKLWRMKSDLRAHDSLYVNDSNHEVWAVSYLNNETGECDYIKYAGKRCFLDLTATIGHVPVNLHKMPNVVGASFSGHKIGSLQGVGVLYIKKAEQAKMRKTLLPKSSWALQGGTPNTLGIYSLGIAITDACDKKKMAKRNDKIERMILYLSDECDKMDLKVHYSEHILNLTFNYLGAMSAVSIFRGYGIDISAGSACHSDSDLPSKALLANDYSIDEALRTIRVSLSNYNTWSDIKTFVKILQKVLANYDHL